MNFASEMNSIRKEVEALKEAKLKSITLMPVVTKTISVTINKTNLHNWFVLNIDTTDHKVPLFMVCYEITSGPQPRLIDSSRRYLGADGKIAIKHLVSFPYFSTESQMTIRITVRCTSDFNLSASVN